MTYKYGEHIEVTQDIVDGYLVLAVKGDYGEIDKPYGNTGCEWIVHMYSGKRLKLNERQIKHYGE